MTIKIPTGSSWALVSAIEVRIIYLREYKAKALRMGDLTTAMAMQKDISHLIWILDNLSEALAADVPSH